MLAYLDPGAGSSIIAILASGTVGVGVAWRVARQRMSARLGRAGDTGPAASVPPGNGTDTDPARTDARHH